MLRGVRNGLAVRGLHGLRWSGRCQVFFWRGIKTRIRRMKCSAYVGDCSYCREWKRGKAAARREAGRESNPRTR